MHCGTVPIVHPPSATYIEMPVAHNNCLPRTVFRRSSGTHRKRWLQLLVSHWILHFRDVLDWDQPVARQSARTCVLCLPPVSSTSFTPAIPRKLTLEPLSIRAWNIVFPICTARMGSSQPAETATCVAALVHNCSRTVFLALKMALKLLKNCNHCKIEIYISNLHGELKQWSNKGL